MGILVMSKKEREQLKIFERLASGQITQPTAAQILKLSTRWIRKKLKRYREQGDAGLVHLNRGRPSSRKWDPNEKALAIELLKSEWRGFGPTFAAEKLAELKNIRISPETLRKAMIANGLWTPGRKRKQYRKWRERKPMRGMLVQLDGSPHDWFEGRGPKCTLLVFIDDATSQILWLEFVESESFKGVAGAAKKYIEKHGRPGSFYVDYGSVFSVNLNNEERNKITQFESIMKQLDIDVIHASSPQAKGRVERCNKTMQDRLIKEMRLAGISSIEEANRFVQAGNFVTRHNAKFAVQPTEEVDAHRSVTEYNLAMIFCTMEERVVTNDFTINYKSRIIQLTKNQPAIVRPKNRVAVREHLDGKLTISIRNSLLNYKEIGMRKKKIKPIDYVRMENENCLEHETTSFPFKENFCGSNNENCKVENRNFSCW